MAMDPNVDETSAMFHFSSVDLPNRSKQYLDWKSNVPHSFKDTVDLLVLARQKICKDVL